MPPCLFFPLIYKFFSFVHFLLHNHTINTDVYLIVVFYQWCDF